MKKSIISALLGLAPIALAFAGTSAHAQTGGGIETVVVTAERRPINLQHAALSATVFSGADLQKKGINVVDQLMFATPSLTVNNFGQGNDFNIRGVGKGESNIQTPSGVVTYRDGVPILGGFVQEEPYYDISHIEVLRGPQGTFAGTNATGGAVFINEMNPDLNAPYSGYTQAQAGTYEDFMIQGAVNIPLSDDAAVRIATDDERHGSFWTIIPGPGFSGHPGRYQAASVRATFLWNPMTNLQVIFKTDYGYFDLGGYPGDSSALTTDPFTVGNNTHNMAVDYSLRSVLDIKYTFDDGMVLHSISGYQNARASEQIDLDGTNFINDTFRDVGKIKIWTQEFNLISPDTGPLKWVAGVFYQHEDDDLPANGGFDIGVPPGGVDVVLTYHTPKQHEAVFGQVTYDITDQWQIQAGARYNHSSFDLQDLQETLVNFGPPIGTVPFGPIYTVPCVAATPPTPACPVTRTGHQEDSKLTGKIALNFKYDDENFLYAFFATGHKDGGQNTTANEPAIIQPEEVRNVEVGWKWTGFDGHIFNQLDGYWNDYKNFQVTLFDPTTQTSPILNAPSAKIYGVEEQVQGSWDAFSFDGNVAWLHSRFGSFYSLTASTPPGPPTFTCNPHTGGNDPNCQNLTGEQSVYAPEWTASVGGQYVFDVGNGQTLTPRLDYAYVGTQWSTVLSRTTLPLSSVRLGVRNLLNAQVAWDLPNSWDITAYSTNTTNLHYIAAENVSLRYAAPPRQWGLRVTKNF